MLYEMYLLIKHGNHNYSDLLIMPVYERKIMIDFLIEEAEQKQKRNDNRNETN